jgi:hypothetical protein
MSAKEADKSAAKAVSGDGELHKPPSMLWFVIPLGLLMLYALLSR